MARHDMRGLKNSKTNEEENQEEQEKSSFGQKVGKLREKLKLGPHYKMERFTVMLGATLSFMLLITVLSFVNYRSDVSNLASSQAQYTENFTFSLSNQQMTVHGVYGNKDRTDVMVLLQMSDPSGMSADAKNYELFVTGENKSIEYEPKVSFSLFGSTGYAIVRFQDEVPLEKQILDVTIRANSELSGRDGSGVSGDVKDNDESFAEFDQGKFYVNPGAENVEELDGLKAHETDPSKLYVALVADAKDKEIHDLIDEQTKELSKLLNRAQEYTNRLVSSGYEAPKAPWFFEGDYVDDDGVFKPASNVSRAHSFDYWSKDITDGYINQVMSDVSEFEVYMKEHAENNADRTDEERDERIERTETLKHKDGSVLELNTVATGTSPSAQVAAKDAVDSLEQSWTQYINIKSKVQRDLMRDLLILDADVQSQSSGYSVQDDKEAIWLY